MPIRESFSVVSLALKHLSYSLPQKTATTEFFKDVDFLPNVFFQCFSAIFSGTSWIMSWDDVYIFRFYMIN